MNERRKFLPSILSVKSVVRHFLNLYGFVHLNVRGNGMKRLRRILERLRGKNPNKEFWESFFGDYELDFSKWSREDFLSIVKGWDSRLDIVIDYEKQKIRIRINVDKEKKK